MTTITTKIAESGRTSFQLNGKRASKAAAIEAAIANMKNGSDNLVDIQIAIDAAKKTVRFDINYYGEIIWQEIKSVKQYKSIGGGHYETYYSPEWTRTTEERANELFAEFGLNTEIICKMVFADNTTTEADIEDTTVEENIKADTTADNRELELIKHNGLSFEGFLATNAGLTIEEYRARKAAQQAAEQAAEQAEAERRTKLFNLKDGIKSAEYTINETSGTLNDIIKKHYRPESDDGSWDEYTAELGDTLATAVSTLNTLKAQLAELEPATDTTTEDNIEAIAETDDSEEDDAESLTANVMPAEDDDNDDELIDEPDRRTIERNSGNYGTWINDEYVRFENHSIVYIDADRKRGFHFCKVNGRKNFYRYGRKIAAAKIAEAYMNGERAAEQSKAHHEFFYAHKLEVGNTFKVSFEITTADGQEHFFSRTFETFAEAKALVDEFTANFSEPTQIVIKQNKQNGDWYYSRDTNGTEKFFDNTIAPTEKITAQIEDKPALVDCAYEFDAENNVREFKIGDAEIGDVISFQGSRLFKITSTKHDARLYRDEDGTLHFDIKCCDGSPQLTMHDVTPDEFFAYVEVHDTTREEIARLTLVKLKRKHARAVDESLRLGEYLFCSEDRTAYDKAHARIMQLICNGCADTAERWRLEEENALRRKRIVDAEIKYSCLQYKIGKYAEEIDAREKTVARPHEHREGVPNVEGDNLSDNSKIVSATPEASTKIKKLFSRRKYHERKKTAHHTQHRPRRMVHAARRH